MSISEENAHAGEQQAPDDSKQRVDGLLHAISAQLLEADRRYTATFAELHDRITAMGQEAAIMRRRVPEQFAPAFGRIEAGVSELAQALTHAGEGAGLSANPSATSQRDMPEDHDQLDSITSEAPMALRSANSSFGIERRRQDYPDRRNTVVDTFDVIESAHTDDEGEPWDRQQADALADMYHRDGGDSGHTHRATSEAPKPSEKKLGVSEEWLESRFAEISRSIETSLAAANTDARYAAFDQKLDRFEQHVHKMFEGVATQDDIGAVRLIEAHVGEVVNHLVQTHDQLSRLNVIEEQLGLISQALIDVQGNADRSAPAPAPVDVEALARRAAELATERASVGFYADRNAAANELKPLIERLMADTRISEENTTALLDTIQQAMIRVLDRVEALEVTRVQAPSPAVAPRVVSPRGPDAVAAPPASHSPADLDETDYDLPDNYERPEPKARVSATVAPPVPASQVSERDVPRETERPDAKNSEKQRHDFIADARRARNRLSANDETADVLISTPATRGQKPPVVPQKDTQSGTRPIRPAPSAAAKAAGPSAPSPRLIVVALGAIMLLTGMWYTFGGSDRPVTALPPAMGGSAAPVTGTAPTNAEDAKQPANPDAQSPDAGENGKRGDLTPESKPASAATKAAVASAPVPRTTLPLIGVAVDVDQPITANDMQQAIRHQSMAEMSGDLGEAAAKSSSANGGVPSSIVPSQSETIGDTAAEPRKTSLTRAKRLSDMDMPPATLGPLSLRLAAANGDPSAEFEIGARFAEGKSKPANFIDAAKWYQKSADAGFAQAQYRLGTLYERGLGLKVDRAKAASLYQAAADQGNIKAMHNLAVLSANQNDKAPDYTTAARWFEEAAKHNLQDSQFNLAILYENGLGVQRDLKTAFMWLSLAARDGDGESVRRRDILRGKLTAEDIAAAQQLIETWKPLPYDRSINDARVAGEAWKKNPANGVNG